MTETCDIAIVGAGAAGLATAIFAAQAIQERKIYPPLRIFLLDGAKSIGAKILVSGGGRCNVTHERISPDDFNGSRTIVRNVLAAFDEQATVQWFESLGVNLKTEETGKLFPTSDSAKSVLAALLGRCDMLGIRILTQHRVTEILSPQPDSDKSFVIRHSQGELRARHIVMATGGRSLPLTGSDGGGWEIVQKLGHAVTPTHPALVPLVLHPSFFNAEISGLSHEAELTTFSAGKPIDKRRGSLLWTHFGISGPLAMDASRHWVIASVNGGLVEMRCNFHPGENFEQIERRWIDITSSRPRANVVNLLAEQLPRRLAEAILKHLGIAGNFPAGQLSRDARRNLVHALTALPLPILRDRGWNYAEVTAGGVPLNEVDFRTMQSRKIAGLYLVGEILDCDGRIGGFNFQWAWSTAYIAGNALSRASDEITVTES